MFKTLSPYVPIPKFNKRHCRILSAAAFATIDNNFCFRTWLLNAEFAFEVGGWETKVFAHFEMSHVEPVAGFDDAFVELLTRATIKQQNAFVTLSSERTMSSILVTDGQQR